MSDYIGCPGCKKQLKRNTTKPEKYRKHKNDHTDDWCDYGQTVVPQEAGCGSTQQTATSQTAECAKSSPADATDPAPSATTSTPSSPSSPAPADGVSTASAPPVIPGVTEYATVLDAMSAEQQARFKAQVEANLTPFSQPNDLQYEEPTLFSQPGRFHLDDGSECPGEGCGHYMGNLPMAQAFSQPAGRKSEAPAEPMTDLGKELTARLKELFYAYDNRRTEDNRSAQATMGPSEMGTPCDRRLALSLMRMPPVNPGGDGWAAFVGTCIHAGLEQMFLWANAGTGRFATETRLQFDSKYVPKGTADLIDRTLFMLDDHKCQGRWSRNKLKSSGPSPTYRVQAHVYAKGARAKGERIEHIAIISWPRDEATLDDLYVFTEPYNPAIADEAFDRVNIIAGQVEAGKAEMHLTYSLDREPSPELDLEIKARVAADFDVADDCRFCPFYLPNARDITRGCNGKR
jgi:hypothetical protein